MAKKKTGKRSSSKGSSGKREAAKPSAARKSGGSRKMQGAPKTPAPSPEVPAAPETPQPEAVDSGAPDGEPSGISLEGLLPSSVARIQLQDVRERLVGEHGFLAYCDHMITNYGAHQAAYALMKSYVDDCKTEFSHEAEVKALGFTDGSDYASVLNRIAELNKAYKDAEAREEESGEESEEVKALKKQIEELQEKVNEGSEAVNEEYEMCKWEHDKLVELIQAPDKIEAAYSKGGRAKTSLINGTYFPRDGAKGKARTVPVNMTIATWYVNDSFESLGTRNEICGKLDEYMDRMRPLAGDLGKPSE